MNEPTKAVRGRWRRVAEGAAVGALLGFLLRDLLPFEMASAWVPFAVVGGAIWPAGLRRTVTGLTLATATIWVLVAFGPLSTWLGPRLVRREPPRAGDAVLVLGSRIQSDGQPTAAAQSRLLHGVELAAAGWTSSLIVTELPSPAASQAPLARDLLDGLGHEHVAVMSVGPVRSTREEALRVGALCRQRDLGHLLVVTTPLHSRRACGVFEAEGLEVTCTPATETEFDLETLDRPVERLLAFRRALRETAALWLYRRRGWLPASDS